jgi:putative ABC transport system permease protein
MTRQSRQTWAVIRSNLNSLPRRIWLSSSMVAAIALVVFVLIGFLAMARGLEQSLTATGADDVAIVLGGGAKQELGSEIESGVVANLMAQAETTGITAISREMVMPVDAARADTGAMQTVSLRGMDTQGATLRPAAAVTEGRLFQSGTYELVVGDYVAATYAGFGIGDTVEIGRSTWTVVGHFSAEGTVFGSEIWAPLDAVQTDFGQGQIVQSLRVGLTTPAAMRSLQPALAAISGAELLGQTEADFYSAQSGRTARLIRFFAWPLALMLAIGAGAGALNTMLGSVAARTTEIATLRALGFSRRSTFWGTWVEAIVLSLIGAALGAALGWLIFDGFSAATMGANQNQFAFSLEVSRDVMRPAVVLALMIGLFGGLIPAWTGSRIKLVTALRQRG